MRLFIMQFLCKSFPLLLTYRLEFKMYRLNWYCEIPHGLYSTKDICKQKSFPKVMQCITEPCVQTKVAEQNYLTESAPNL